MGLFRRNKKNNAQNSQRTMQQKQPSQRVISYYTASRRQLDNFERNSPQVETSLAYRRIERIRSAWFLIVVGSVLAVALGYLAVLGGKPHVSVQGPQYRSAAVYEERVDAAFGNDIRNYFKPLLQQKTIEQAISQQIPEAKSVTVRSSLLGHRPEVKIVTDDTLAIFSQPNGTDVLIGNRGKLLLPIAEATQINTTTLPVIQNQTGVEGKAGEQFMRPDEAQAVMRLLAQYKADNAQPLLTLTTIPHELLVKEPGRGSYAAKYLLNDTVVSQYGSLRATEKKLQELGQTPAEYIDVRLADKVYYK